MEAEEYKGIQNIKKVFENSNSNTNNNNKDEDGEVSALSFKDLKSKFESSSPNSISSANSYIEVKLKSPTLNQVNQSKLSSKASSLASTPSSLKSPTLSTTKLEANSNTTTKKGIPPQIPNKPSLKSKPPPIPTTKPDLNLLKPKFHSRSPSIRKSQSPVNQVEIKQEENIENEYSFINSQLKSPNFRKSPSPIGDEKSLNLESNDGGTSNGNNSSLFKRSANLKPIQRAATLNESQSPKKSPIKERFNIIEEPPKLPQRRIIEPIQVEEPEQLDHLFTELKNPFSPSYNSNKSESSSPPRLPPRGNTLPIQSTTTKPLTPLRSPQPKLVDIWYDKIPQKNKLRYEKLFKDLDTELEGFIWGPEARNIMIRSRLDCDSLANIWDLVDMNRDGQLDKKEFCIMIYLIDRRLQGYEIPSNL